MVPPHSQDSMDPIIGLVNNSQRRMLLNYMQDTETDRFSRDELVDHLLDAPEKYSSPERQDRSSISIRLHHLHLPKLEQAGILRYDAINGIVHYYGGLGLRNREISSMLTVINQAEFSMS